MRTLGLDIATVTGYSLLEDDILIEYGTLCLDKTKNTREKLIEFKKKLLKLIKELKPQQIVIENVYSSINIQTTQFLNMLRGIVICSIPIKIQIIGINASNARKIVLHKGNASKEEVFNYITLKYNLNNFVFKTHNDITDSILLVLASRFK